jgi:hypothetical protein
MNFPVKPEKTGTWGKISLSKYRIFKRQPDKKHQKNKKTIL